ncbi:MAG: hypothetical protein CL728_05260 [Chloroflexi bacterium]|nr:hypothetical protein [Chloroflexota bacterium]|tara:strand:+ start:1180 stop:1368 length:189 start_codon:yes stop_codon:yes gene_type:complete
MVVSMFKKEHTFDQEEISDLHKEVHNIRPSYEWWEMWHDANKLQKQRMWNELIVKSIRRYNK